MLVIPSARGDCADARGPDKVVCVNVVPLRGPSPSMRLGMTAREWEDCVLTGIPRGSRGISLHYREGSHDREDLNLYGAQRLPLQEPRQPRCLPCKRKPHNPSCGL